MPTLVELHPLPQKWDPAEFRASGYFPEQLKVVAQTLRVADGYRSEAQRNNRRVDYLMDLFPPELLPTLSEHMGEDVTSRFLTRSGLQNPRMVLSGGHS